MHLTSYKIGVSSTKALVKILLIILVLIFPLVSSAADRESCADSLDGMKRVLRDANDKADEAKDQHRAWKSCKDSLSSGYDSDGDRCEGKASRLRSADGDLNSELSTLERKYRSVKSDCSAPDRRASASAAKTGDEHCDVYRAYLGQMGYPTLLNLCKQYMPEDECGKCLGFRPTVSGIVVLPPAVQPTVKRSNK